MNSDLDILRVATSTQDMLLLNVVDVNSFIRGYLIGKYLSDEHLLEIEKVEVSDLFRRQGIATELVDRTLREAALMGATAVKATIVSTAFLELMSHKFGDQTIEVVAQGDGQGDGMQANFWINLPGETT